MFRTCSADEAGRAVVQSRGRPRLHLSMPRREGRSAEAAELIRPESVDEVVRECRAMPLRPMIPGPGRGGCCSCSALHQLGSFHSPGASAATAPAQPAYKSFLPPKNVHSDQRGARPQRRESKSWSGADAAASVEPQGGDAACDLLSIVSEGGLAGTCKPRVVAAKNPTNVRWPGPLPRGHPNCRVRR